ncbi:ABC transporter substrate-binding protein [Nesterenkonia pannonica]|uniref:ABC transporter substrate-binding protein n=1 Tax=Nesterenkonia pannonica TaxID=1548602 RepID=UPI002164EF9D|nr:ABC transporter substrate-binding protein [Nesterenkonia pannonica]
MPITCSSPIINAAAMGIFEQYGLNVTLQRYTGWGELWIAFVAGELDATQMLIPMPLGIHHNFAVSHRATRLPYITNTNGQAITLGLQHEGRVNGPEDFDGLTLAVPFDYSGHNLLLRDYLALGGLDPDYDVGIQVMRPSDMVAALNVGDIDGFLAPDPFNQRAVAIGAGYLYTLSKELWDGHPCCSFAVADEFAAANPNTYATLLRAIGDSAMWTDQPDHRSLAAETMAGRAFLSQDPAVLDAVLSGDYEDGTGQEHSVEDRIGFQPYPHESYAIWALTQLQRWDLAPTEGYDSAEDYQRAVRDVLDPDTAVPILEELGADTSPGRQKPSSAAHSTRQTPALDPQTGERMSTQAPETTAAPSSAEQGAPEALQRRARAQRARDRVRTTGLFLAFFLAFIAVWHLGTAGLDDGAWRPPRRPPGTGSWRCSGMRSCWTGPTTWASSTTCWPPSNGCCWASGSRHSSPYPWACCWAPRRCSTTAWTPSSRS